jgi:YHS domain-containing protein
MKSKYLISKFVWTSSMMLACLFISFQAGAASKDSIREQLVNTKPANGSLKFSPIFEGRGDGVVTCPVTGEKITAKNLKAEYFGRTVYFCCKGCYQRGTRLPTKYIKPTMEEQQQAVKAYLAKVPEAPPGEEICNE